MKQLELFNQKLNFTKVKLFQFKDYIENTFKNYKSKTLKEILNKDIYKSLKKSLNNQIEFNMPLGIYLN